MTADALDFDADPFGTLRAGSAPLQPSRALDLFEDETLAYAARGGEKAKGPRAAVMLQRIGCGAGPIGT
jgi:hypothetical protein